MFLDILILIDLFVILFHTVLFIFVFVLPFQQCLLSLTFIVSSILYIFNMF